jgi:hypothetical protein
MHRIKRLLLVAPVQLRRQERCRAAMLPPNFSESK